MNPHGFRYHRSSLKFTAYIVNAPATRSLKYDTKVIKIYNANDTSHIFPLILFSYENNCPDTFKTIIYFDSQPNGKLFCMKMNILKKCTAWLRNFLSAPALVWVFNMLAVYMCKYSAYEPGHLWHKLIWYLATGVQQGGMLSPIIAVWCIFGIPMAHANMSGFDDYGSTYPQTNGLFFLYQNFLMLFTIDVKFLHEISPQNLVSTVSTDALVLQHQGISSHSAECAPMCFFISIHVPDKPALAWVACPGILHRS